MEKFETGKIYRSKEHFGCGYDSNSYYCYFKIIRRTDSTIWFNLQKVQIEMWGSPTKFNNEELANENAIIKLNKDNNELYKARVSKYEDKEDFKFNNNYYFLKYMKTI